MTPGRGRAKGPGRGGTSIGSEHGSTLPSLPLGPGRAPFSKRARRRAGLVLALLLLVAVALGVALVHRLPRAAGRVVTIPAADRAASPSLLRAAEAVGFEPTSAPGSGLIEGRLAVADVPSARALLPPGTRAPGFSLRTPTGARVSLDAQRGRAVLLEFFATWCPHCNAEAPHLELLARSLPASRLLAVDADGETAPSVLAFHIYYGLDFPALLDPSRRPGSFHAPGAGGRVSTAYRVHAYPTFYVVDPSGRVAWAAVGEQPDSLLRAELVRARDARPR
jgi:thiol-disulfide isomerase/thioredoxin